jgi:hypothetical protein
MLDYQVSDPFLKFGPAPYGTVAPVEVTWSEMEEI